MKKIIYLYLVIPVLVFAQSQNQNYIKTTTYKVETNTTITNPNVNDAAVSVQYFDGLGRPIQQVAHQQSTTRKDIIVHSEYDQLGRQVKEFLPYVREQSSLNYDTGAQNAQMQFYGNNNFELTGNPHFELTGAPFSEKELEASPLSRVFKQAAPGNPWSLGGGKEVKLAYDCNETDEVVFFGVITSPEPIEGCYNTEIDLNGYYDRCQLYKNTTKDENWTSGHNNTTIEYKDKQGRVVLKRTYNDNVKHDTYYVYDKYGNLSFVIPPAVDVSQPINQDILNGLCYQYKYDYRNRLVEKKLPGKQWEYIVYDKMDKPVATGPALDPFGGNTTGWMITKYDRFSRVVYTGWIEQEEFTTEERHATQLLVNGNNTPQYESKLAQPITVNSVSLPYSNDVQPSGGIIILTINYYDDYAFTAAPSTIPSQINGVEILQNVKGMPTGNWTRVLTSPNELLAETSFMYYDKRGRAFYTKVNNHLGGHTETFSRLDFQGTPLETQTIHQRDSNPLVVTIIDEFEYLHNGKLKKHIQKVNNNPQELIVANTYDELGQLISKQVGGQDIQNEIGYQKIDYRYNIRGWLTHINDIEDLRENGALNDDLFAFKINYNEITEVENGDMNFVATSFNNTVKPLFNGNIAETYWKTGTDDILRKYSYSYDDLNRLKKAYFQKPFDVVPHTQSFDEYIDYDKNGNILELNRFADHNEYGNVIEIDALSYSYAQNSNRLMKVTDATNFGAGFQDDGEDGDDSPDQNDDYAYDNNGNMISDENKGIVRITYNHLNLPTSIRFVNGEIRYLYTAAGVKVGKTVYQGSQAPVVTDYLGGFQYVKGNLQFFPHPEGYVSVVKFGPETLVINYAYQYKDHLGNIRLNYGKDPETNVLKVLEENHYYPFGLKHQNYNTGRRQLGKKEEILAGNLTLMPAFVLPTEEKPMVYKYKYNSKEFQDELGLNMYDYGWRNYDPAIARWVNSDPLLNDLKFTFDTRLDEKDDEIDMLDAFSTMVEVGGGIYNPHNLNPYSYGYNNPVSFDDPDGRCPWCIAAIKGAAQEYATQVIGNLIEGKSLGDALTQVDGGKILKTALVDGLTLGMGSLVSKGTKAVSIAKSVDKANDTKKAVEKAKKVEKAVNGNSKTSEKAQTIYGLKNKDTGNIEKVGISGGKVDKNGKPYRANKQKNNENKNGGNYEVEVLDKVPSGSGARTKALELEKKHTDNNSSTIDPRLHKRPKPN
ncbi:DUF6443 domain-containing protein [Flavobacterium filum]|uniref:DUF6443 domain-containing protein n=1 Tax=Flavobacterium filum TaxID=370974 RepID=UPI000403B3E4|nr:DUF6443 domain-containing protein [Flavobacterium filum]